MLFLSSVLIVSLIAGCVQGQVKQWTQKRTWGEGVGAYLAPGYVENRNALWLVGCGKSMRIKDAPDSTRFQVFDNIGGGYRCSKSSGQTWSPVTNSIYMWAAAGVIARFDMDVGDFVETIPFTPNGIPTGSQALAVDYTGRKLYSLCGWDAWYHRSISHTNIYDIQAKVWLRRGPNMRRPLESAYAVTVENFIYLVGGFTTDNNYVLTAESGIYRMDTNYDSYWESFGSLSKGRGYPRAFPLRGNIYIFGGQNSARNTDYADFDVFNIETRSVVGTYGMGHARTGGAVFANEWNRRLMVFGGTEADVGQLDWQYSDPRGVGCCLPRRKTKRASCLAFDTQIACEAQGNGCIWVTNMDRCGNCCSFKRAANGPGVATCDALSGMRKSCNQAQDCLWLGGDDAIPYC